MKIKSIAFALAAALLALTACGPAEKAPEKIEIPTQTDEENDKPIVIDVADKSFFDGMTEEEFRRTVKPYLEAWYDFIYRGTWTDAVTLSGSHEMIETEAGDRFIKTAHFKRPAELAAYIGTWLSESMFTDLLDVRTYTAEDGLYVLQTASGWYGEPDYFTCRELEFSDSVSYVCFDEIWGMGTERTYVHVVKFAKENGNLKIIGHLSSADSVLLAARRAYETALPADVMNDAEFKALVTLYLLRYDTLIGVINYNEDTICRCPERETEDTCVAGVSIDGVYHYVTLGKDRSGTFGILSIEKA